MTSLESIHDIINIFNKKIKKNNKIINKCYNLYRLIENDILNFITNKESFTKVKRCEMIEIIKPYLKITLENGIYISFIQMITLYYREPDKHILELRNYYPEILFNYIEKINQIMQINSSNDDDIIMILDSCKFITFEKTINEIKNIIISQINYTKKSKDIFGDFIKLS